MLGSKHLLHPTELSIELICNRNKDQQLGTILLDHVEKFGKEHGYSHLVLDAVAEKPLKRWYESKGFVVDKVVPFPDSKKPKVYRMYKTIE